MQWEILPFPRGCVKARENVRWKAFRWKNLNRTLEQTWKAFSLHQLKSCSGCQAIADEKSIKVSTIYYFKHGVGTVRQLLCQYFILFFSRGTLGGGSADTNSLCNKRNISCGAYKTWGNERNGLKKEGLSRSVAWTFIRSWPLKL